MSDLPVAQWFFHVAEAQGRGIMLALLTLTSCAPRRDIAALSARLDHLLAVELRLAGA